MPKKSKAADLAVEVASKDPTVGLRAVVALRQLLEDLERLHVDNARKQEAQPPPQGHGVGGLMFERFTDRARRVLVLAQEDAVEMGHHFLGTEHELLGLLNLGEGIAHDVLAGAGFAYDSTRDASSSGSKRSATRRRPCPPTRPSPPSGSTSSGCGRRSRRASARGLCGSRARPSP